MVFIYAGDSSSFSFEKVFSLQSAFDRVLVWSKSIESACNFIACTQENYEKVSSALADLKLCNFKIIKKDSWSLGILLESMALKASENSVDNVIFTFASMPFLDLNLTKQLLHDHDEYLSEYTFADGWPIGFAPEVIDSGTLNILSSLCKAKEKENAVVTHDAVFDLMRLDINSFEIESVISEKDYRMLRLEFLCNSKRNFLACKNLFEEALNTHTAFSATSLSNLAEKEVSVQKTVPAYYCIQLTENMALPALYSPYPEAFQKKYSKLPFAESNPNPKTMSLESFNALLSQIEELSSDAVISLSAWSDPLCVKNISEYVELAFKHKGFTVLLETDASLLTDEAVQKIKNAVLSPERIIWIVSLDAFSDELYKKMHCGKGSLESAKNAVEKLSSSFPGSVYPQFTRMNINECELEGFYRFWSESSSPTLGKVIIQKYDWYCGLLPQEKPADLSPLEREPCWHIKRDVTVLCDGSVPLCREHILDQVLGNVFNEGLDFVWNKMNSFLEEHLSCKYNGLCEKCDEYYTFNF